MAHIDFIAELHTQTRRDYLERVLKFDKARCAEVSKRFGYDYWDGQRRYGYGGYRYDGRWASVAARLIEHYGLSAGDRVLDIGCGKGYLLYELQRIEPGLEIRGIDISMYATRNAKPEISSCLDHGSATALPYRAGWFDLVLSINTLHYLPIYDFVRALREVTRVARKNSYIVLESYRDETEKANLIYWQLGCECFYTPEEWRWLFERYGYKGDYSFVFFG